MRHTLIVLIVFGCALFEPAAVEFQGRPLNSRTAIHDASSAVPIIEIQGAAKFAQNDPLVFRCRISKSGREPLYIYSSLLQNPQFAEILIDRKERLIELRFTRTETSPLLPYYFPQAAFREITARQAENFIISSKSAIKEIRGFEILNQTSKEARITAGRWQFRIMIGYGIDVSAVKLALASPGADKQHPINEIVKWQEVAFSNSITIDITK